MYERPSFRARVNFAVVSVFNLLQTQWLLMGDICPALHLGSRECENLRLALSVIYTKQFLEISQKFTEAI